ncbi:MAG: phospholipid/cholesterol/gamma-HCH transport system substrate-binding protein [Acidobacteriota bacterium]|jgi:phospholipid/cholesterol/gamma-HCH transport system substrate-binding protein|nr:phospholipid/cholesterol/gamma-HCH transport system substrate-binding protein [Acidobacteriota bacterium]
MPSAKKRLGIREVRVGLLVVIAVGVLIFLILNASGDISPFSKKVHLRARFSNGDGLRRGSEVRLAGVRIGKVDDVRLLPPSENPREKVEASFSIDSEIDGRPATDLIRNDSKALLSSPSILGAEKVINLTPGSDLGQQVHDGDLIPPGDEGGTVQALTTSGTQLMDQLNKLSEQFTDISAKINQGQGSIGRFVNDEAFYNNLNSTVRDLNEVIRQIQAGHGSAGMFVNDPALYNNLTGVSQSLQSIADDLRRGRGTAGRLLTDEALYNDARTAIARLNHSVDNINLIVEDLRAGRGTAGKLLTDDAIYNDARSAIARFNTAAERVDNVVAGVQRGEGTAGKLLTDDQLYNNVNQLSAETVKLIYDFRQNPKKYLTIKFQLF